MLVTAFGIPGCGKSTIIRHVAALFDVDAYCEPEELEWPEVVLNREKTGYVTAVHWFRSVRVPRLFKARALANAGHLVFVDSYYDKLCNNFISNPRMDWFIRRKDPYFDNIRELARLDYKYLPDADILIFLEVGKKDYDLMLKRRGRILDRASGFQHEMQADFKRAADKYISHRRGRTRLVCYQNGYSSPGESARELRKVLLPLIGQARDLKRHPSR